jgi:hypothetical protein
MQNFANAPSDGYLVVVNAEEVSSFTNAASACKAAS